MSITVDGVRIADLPDLGAVTSTSSVVGEQAGSGRFMASALLRYTATNGNTARSALDRASDALNVLDYGAIGDGNSHPLSGVTTYAGYNTTGWSIGQWRAVFPFATGLSNELDHCAVMTTIIAAVDAGKAVRIPGGIYRAAETLPVVLDEVGPLSIFGDGRGATRCECHGAFDWFNLTVLPTQNANGSMGFRELSVYQANNVLGGHGIAVTGPSTTNGRPTITIERCDIGNVAGGATNGTVGAFTIGALLQNCGFGYVANCTFAGSISSGGATQGIGIRLNGNSTFPSFGPITTSCVFYNLQTAVQAGDGVAAYVQGLQMDACSVVYCDYGVYWVIGTGSANDGLTISGGTNLQCLVACVLSDGVAVHNITGNYFLGMPGASLIHMRNSNNLNCFLHMAGNSFVGFGYAGCAAVRIDSAGTTPQASFHLAGNSFVSFNDPPIILAAGSKHVAVTGNSFSDCVASTDAGDNVWYNNVALAAGGSTINAVTMFQQGPPGTPQPYMQNQIMWNAASPGRAYYDPTIFFNQGGLRLAGNVELNGVTTFNSPYANWSQANWGKQMLITTTGVDNPGIAITDTTGANLFGIGNAAGKLQIAAMPAYDDTTTGPAYLLEFTSTDVIAAAPLQCASTVGFNNQTPIAKPTVTGAKGGNAAMASLLSALAAYGLITDATS